MEGETRKYITTSGNLYTQRRHCDERGDLLGEFWERQTGSSGDETINSAAYVSQQLCDRITKEYVRSKMETFDKRKFVRLINMGKREHYKGPAGRIVYLYKDVKIYASTVVEQIEPAFE